MSEKSAKSFKLPKIKRQESKDNLRQVDVVSRDCQELINVVKRSYLSNNYEPKWQVKTAAFVDNRKLENSYRAKKSEMKEGRHSRDMVDQFAFLVVKEPSKVSMIVRNGLRSGLTKQTFLGDYKMGVYLWRNADIQLRLSESWGMQQCTLIIFKIVLGKCKSLSPGTGDENIEPTPNFDCHIPQMPARPSDSFHQQISRSQVYLYEYTEDCEPSPYPRQCLPYAVVTYEKTGTGPRSVLEPYDSYSKRPVRKNLSDSDVKSSGQRSLNPRPRMNESQGSGGLDDKTLPRDINTFDPNDPRSQLSFLATTSTQKFEGYQYQPSYGPDETMERSPDIIRDEVDMDVEEEENPEEPLSSLPPISLPVIPDDTRLMMPDIYPRDPRIEQTNPVMRLNSSDPRLRQQTDNQLPTYSLETAPPSDPRIWSRQTQADPRLSTSDYRSQSTNLDPRLAKSPSDPRLNTSLRSGITHASSDPRLQSVLSDSRSQSVPSDPRLQPIPSDPRLQSMAVDPKLPQVSSDPRLHQIQSKQRTAQLSSPMWQSQSETKSDEPKIRKKLSLSDYKKKVNITKPDNTDEKQNTIAEVETNSVEQNLPYKSQMISNSDMNPQSITDTREGDVSSSNISKDMSESQEDDIWSETDDIDLRIKPVSSADMNLAECDNAENDIVEEHDDMAKTLNELSDPDDLSQSPRSGEEISVEEPAAEDPMLAKAMQKLVEHSGDVSLFTEALRDLQESAEEFGERLTDPEFLVKKIAEKIDAISKAKQSVTEIVIDDDDDNDDGIQSPDMIMSPERSNTVAEPVKHIPLENINKDEDNPKRSTESSLDIAMQKTLLELEKVEQQKKKVENSNAVHENIGGESNVIDKTCSKDLTLDDIPIPPDPPRPKQHPTKLEGKVKSKFRTIHIPSNETEKDDDEEDDELMVTNILPSLNQKKKPVISFNLKKANKPPVSKLFKNDLRSRTSEQAVSKIENDQNQEKTYKRPVFGLTDEDLRITDDKLNPRSSVNFRSSGTDVASCKSSTNLVEGVNPSTRENSKLSMKSGSELYDPFDLDAYADDGDDDDRIDKGRNKLGDEDWRNRPSDVDLRTENSQSSAGDFDMRRSHSRSVSPTAVAGTKNSNRKENSVLQNSEKVQPPVKKEEFEDNGSNMRQFIDPFGLDDEYVLDKKIASKSSTFKPNTDSNSGSQEFFDAYNLGKSKPSENTMPTRNEFGDVDWRQAAAAEMGDVDLRSVQNDLIDGEPVVSKSSMPSNIKLSDNKADPFVQLNKNIQNMFNQSPISQQPTAGQYYESYRTSESKTPYEHYRSAAVPEYRTSKPQNKSDMYNYTTSKNQNEPQIGFQNLMQKLDLSNLKNILATVQKPSLSISNEYSDRKEEDSAIEKDHDDRDKPAFVTGLSSAASRKPLSRNYGQTVGLLPTPKISGASPSSYKDHTPTSSRVKIPGFDTSPDSNSGDEKSESSRNSPSKMFNTEKDDVSPKKLQNSDEKSSSGVSEWKLSESLTSTPKSTINSSPQTPKNSRLKESEEVMTPLPNISYQAAILESMEQSALKVRHDDSHMSEMDDSPLILKRNFKKSERKLDNMTRMDEDTAESIKKELKCEQVNNKTAEDADEDDDDDDEISGLVIDLSPTARTPKHELNTPTLDERPEESLDLTYGGHDEVMITEEAKNTGTIDLEDERSHQVKTKDEMTDMIAQSRKNMVIKLKEGTKRVDLKTGKAYSDVSVGSAIEVIGKSSNTVVSSAQIHPIQGIVSGSSSFRPVRSKSPIITSVSDNHQISPSSISTIVSGINRPSSPINFFMGKGTQPQLVQRPMMYVHPVTGAAIKYGPQTYPHANLVGPPIVAVPNQGIPLPSGPQPIISPVSPMVAMPMPVPVIPHMSQPMNTITTCAQSIPYLPTGHSLHRQQMVSMPAVSPMQNVGIAIQTIGTSSSIMNTTPVTSTAQSDSKSDVFDCFRDKFEKRPTDMTSSYEKESSGNIRERINMDKLKSYSSNNVLVKIETTDTVGKRRASDEPTPEQIKKQKYSVNVKHSDFDSRILESFAEVKNESPERSKPNADKMESKEKKSDIEDTTEDKVSVDSGEVSELEDGEISDDSMNSEDVNVLSDKRLVKEVGRDGILVTMPMTYSNIPTIGSRYPESPKRIVNIRSNYSQPMPAIDVRSSGTGGAYRSVGADWANIINNPETKSVERTRATNKELHNPGPSYDDAAAIVSKSAASITKTRLKSRAQCQVKTLGEWLKLELEIDNIEPLQKIIPYALNTDLTKIPKQRKRRIRMKVKNAIAQEGTKGSMKQFSSSANSDDEDEIPKALNPRYAPEVTSEQTSAELELLLESLNKLRQKLKTEYGNNYDFLNACHNSNTPGSISSEDLKMIGALTHVETEMKLHLSRTCYYGYPHRRVPDELLLSSELGGFKSEEEDVFLILMIPFSLKPYNKLVDEKKAIQNLYQRKKSTKSLPESVEIENEIKKHHKQRQAVLRGFTGYLNKKRLQKLQEAVNKYTLVYDFFKCVHNPPINDSKLKFIRTTQMDLRQHLILAKQYLAMDDQKQQP